MSIRKIPLTSLRIDIILQRKFGTKHQHTPLIKFIGKRGKHEHDDHVIPSNTTTTTKSVSVSNSSTVSKAVNPAPVAPKPIKSSPNAVEFYTLKGKAMFGRPKFYDDEVEAILSGGASAV